MADQTMGAIAASYLKLVFRTAWGITSSCLFGFFFGIARKQKSKSSILSLFIFNISPVIYYLRHRMFPWELWFFDCLFNIATYLFRLRDLSLQYLMLQWSSCRLRIFVTWKFLLLLKEFCFPWKKWQEHHTVFFYQIYLLKFYPFYLLKTAMISYSEYCFFWSAEVKEVIRRYHITRRY